MNFIHQEIALIFSNTELNDIFLLRYCFLLCNEREESGEEDESKDKRDEERRSKSRRNRGKIRTSSHDRLSNPTGSERAEEEERKTSICYSSSALKSGAKHSKKSGP